jgi:hypothetical protein
MRRKPSCFLALVVLLAGAARADLLTNGDFESGLTGWTPIAINQMNIGGGTGGWFLQSGTGSPLNGLAVPAPPSPTHAAMTDQTGPGSYALLQTFTVSPSTSVLLSFDWFIYNPNLSYFSPSTLDIFTVFNQQVRVDILSSGAGPFDLGATDLLNAFQTHPGDPSLTGYHHFSTDLTSLVGAGGTFQLRFAEATNTGSLLFGIDNVSLTSSAPVAIPEPSSLAMVGSAILRLAFLLRRKHLCRDNT